MITLTDHANQRLEERLDMTRKQISDLLKKGGFITISIEPGTNRHHQLFYSENDGKCFVAVQDIKTNEIVTILPANGNREIDGETCEKAREMFNRISPKTFFVPKVFQVDQIIRFNFELLDNLTGKTKIIQLKMSANKYLGCLEPIEENIDLLDNLKSFLEKIVSENESLISLTFKLSRKNAGKPYPFQKISEARRVYEPDD